MNKNIFFTEQELYEEVERCLNCIEKPCQKACPVGCSPKDFILALKSKERSDFKTSARIIMGANPLGGVCGAVCPDWFCVKACSRKLFDNPINIPKIQATIIEIAKKENLMPEFEKAKPNGKKVAVVGGGAAGLGAAVTLSQLGYSTDIYEKNEVGGIMNIIPL